MNYKKILESTSDIILTHHDREIAFYINPNLVRTLGYSTEVDYTHKDFLSWIHPDDIDSTLNNYSSHLRNREPFFQIEFRLKNVISNYLLLQANIKFVKNHERGETVAIITILDISFKHELESKVRSKESLLSSIFSAVPDIIFTFDIETLEVSYFNKSIPDFLGYPQHSGFSLKKFVATILPTRDKRQIYRELVYFKKISALRENVLKLLTFENKYNWYYIRSVPFKDYSTSKKVLVVGHNITSRKLTESKLSQESLLVYSIFENAPIPMAMFDKKGYLVKYNRARKELFNLPDQSFGIGRFNIYHSRFLNQANLLDYVSRVYAGEVVEINELALTKSEGEWNLTRELCINLIFYPVKNDSGVVEYVLSFITDITKVKDSEKTLLVKQKYLKAIVDIQNYFISINSYDYYDILPFIGETSGASRILAYSAQETNSQYLYLKAFWSRKRNIKRLNRLHIKLLIPKFSNLFHKQNPIRSRTFSKKRSGFCEKYTLTFSILNQGELTGMIIIEKVNVPWTDVEIDLLKLLTMSLSLFEERKSIEKALIITKEKYKQLAIENQGLLDVYKKEVESKAILLEDINHRVKNNLSSILGILEMESKRKFTESSSYESVFEDIKNRIRGISYIHNILYESKWERVPLHKIIHEIVKNTLDTFLDSRKVFFEYKDISNNVSLSSKQASAIGLVLGELVTNTMKYAFPFNKQNPQIQIFSELTENKLKVVYKDNGIGFPEDVIRKNRSNVGLKLLDMSVRLSLRGQYQFFNDSGGTVEISFTVS
jgi:PAS domain S-box-containing protein